MSAVFFMAVLKPLDKSDLIDTILVFSLSNFLSTVYF